MADTKKVLIVEDYPDIAQLYAFLLKKSGFEVAVANDGKDALAQVLSFTPDVILLDIMIPDIDGLEVLQTIRKDPRYNQSQPAILVTTNVLQDSISDKAKQYGANGLIIKADVGNQELLAFINAILDNPDKYLDRTLD